MVIKCTKLYNPGAYSLVAILPTRFFHSVMLQSWPLTLKNDKVFPLTMVITCTKFYDPGAKGLVSILLLLCFIMTLTFDLENNRSLPLIIQVVINHTELYDPGFYILVSILHSRFFYYMQQPWPLTLKNNRVLPLFMVIKDIKLKDPGVYHLVSILPTRSWRTEGQLYTIIRLV
jgi:hypothetical protein